MSGGIVFQVETTRILQIIAKEIYDSPLALLRENLGFPLGRTLSLGMAAEYERTVAAARAAIDAEAFAAAWEEGRTLTPEQAVAYALQQEESFSKTREGDMSA